MAKRKKPKVDCQRIELSGVRYVIVRESVFDRLCEQAEVRDAPSVSSLDLDGPSLAEKLLARRKSAGLSQAGLAREAGIRPETLNRIERGRTSPDFSTIRKLVVALNAVECAL